MTYKAPVRDLMFSLKQISPSAVTYMSLPVAQSDVQTEYGSSEILNETKVKELGTAIKDGTIEQFLAANPELKNDATHGV